MNIMYLREAHLDILKSAIHNNIDFYQKDDSWLDSFFADDGGWFLPSNVHVDEIELIEPNNNEHFDLENTKILYSALKDLTISQASDERLWAYFTHVTFWKYMRLRWPVEKYIEKPLNESAKNIRERYFFSSKPLVRNGIARLWWYGYVSYDENRNDPFELTNIMLSKLDIAQNLLERNFSLNNKITKAILSVLSDMEHKNKPSPTRKEFRELSKYINLIGGVTILDALSRDEVKKIIINKIEKLRQSA